MIFSYLKHTLAKGPPKTICYRDLIKKRSIVTWNLKCQSVRIPFKSFCKLFKAGYSYLLLFKENICYNNKSL